MKKVLIIIGAIVAGLVALGVAIFVIVSLTSSKMKCTSSVGNITLMYNDNEITGYIVTNMSYDLDTQKEYSKLIGVESYLDEFEDWFEDNTDGTCSR